MVLFPVFRCPHTLYAKTYLDLFRVPSIIPLVKNAYIPPSVTATVPVTLHSSTTDPRPIEDNLEPERPDVFQHVLPMKAALYFDSADGFGEWRILISTRADRDLRQARKRDAKMFGIYIKKIKRVALS